MEQTETGRPWILPQPQAERDGRQSVETAVDWILSRDAALQYVAEAKCELLAVMCYLGWKSKNALLSTEDKANIIPMLHRIEALVQKGMFWQPFWTIPAASNNLREELNELILRVQWSFTRTEIDRIVQNMVTYVEKWEREYLAVCEERRL